MPVPAILFWRHQYNMNILNCICLGALYIYIVILEYIWRIDRFQISTGPNLSLFRLYITQFGEQFENEIPLFLLSFAHGRVYNRHSRDVADFI